MIVKKEFRALLNDGLFCDGDWVESKDQNPLGEVRLIQLADIGVGEYLDKSNRFMTLESAKNLKCTFLEKGDILIARMPDPIGRACIFPGDVRTCVTVVDVCIARPNPNEIYAKWLMHMINSNNFHSRIIQYVTGTTRQRISRSNLASLEVFVPPLEDQKRIAAILDKADAIRRKRQETIKLADEFLRAVFLDMFGDPVTNPKNWKTKQLKQLGRSITGSTPPSQLENMWGNETPFATPGDLDGLLKTTVRNVTKEGAKKSRSCRRGSLLACCIGATIGKVSIAGLETTFNQQINAQEWSDDINDDYGYFVFKLYPELITKNAIKTTLPILKKSLFDEIEIPVPDIKLQNDFSKIVNSTWSIKGKYQIPESDNLFESLSQKVFS